jgi:hypothetical protein
LARFRELDERSRDSFRPLGCSAERPFFPHRLYHLPQTGPDGLQVANWLCGVRNPDQVWEIVLFARGSVLDEFPADLFFDSDVVWHQQHYGMPGQVAYAVVAIVGRDLFGLSYVSDLVQRIGRRRELKTRIENRFRAWPRLLMNGVLAFASERGLRRVWSPSSRAVLEHVDPERAVQPMLFERVYDHTVSDSYVARRSGKWWVMDVADNQSRISMPRAGEEQIGNGKTVCVCHDIERHWGHLRDDPAFADAIREPSVRYLDEMLRVERDAAVRATYCVLGRFLRDIRAQIAEGGHAVAFHSYDHDPSAPQLTRCREVDRRIVGYRPPQSRLTHELRDTSLCRRNFQWLASAQNTLRVTAPTIRRRVVKIPILLDDYPLYLGATSYERWEAAALAAVARHDFVALSLHDCYASHWLPHYPQFLDRLRSLAPLSTLDEVSRSVVLANGA